MEQISGFFENPNDVKNISKCSPEAVHTSSTGYSQIFKAIFGGKMRAFKALKPEYRGKQLYEDLLMKEYDIGCTLDHPGIRQYNRLVNIPEIGNCIEMEWVDGMTLDDFDSRDTKQMLRIIFKLCDALGYIHSKQIVHRDLKPSNILITHNGHNVKLIDFGFSDADSYTMFKTPAGTVSYAAPELIAGKTTDCRADIYSLGLIIKQLLPSRRLVWMRCLKQKASGRYNSVTDVKSALIRTEIIRRALVLLAVIAAVCATLMAPWKKNAMEEGYTEPEVSDTSSEVVTDNPDSVALEELFEEATKVILDHDARN